MAFLATNKGSINERFVVRLEVKDDKVRVRYQEGSDTFAAYAELDDAKEFMDKINRR